MSDVDKDMDLILNKDNYEYWKTMTEASMVLLDCWDAVDPGLTAAERVRPEYVKMDNKARAYIFRHVRPEYLRDIRGLKTAKECWKALEERHGRPTSMDIALWLRELGTIKKTPSMVSPRTVGKSNSCVTSYRKLVSNLRITLWHLSFWLASRQIQITRHMSD